MAGNSPQLAAASETPFSRSQADVVIIVSSDEDDEVQPSHQAVSYDSDEGSRDDGISEEEEDDDDDIQDEDGVEYYVCVCFCGVFM